MTNKAPEFKFKPAVRESIRLRFESRIDFGNDCWNWTGTTNKGGYGQFAYGHGDK